MLLNTRLAVWFGSSVVLCEVLLFSFGDHFIILLRQMTTLKKLILEEPDEGEWWQQRLMARLPRGEIRKGGIPSIQHNFLYPTGLQSSSSCDFNWNSLEMQINSLRKFYQFHSIIFTQFCWDLKRSTCCNWIISLPREEFDEEYRSKQEEYEEELREWKKEAKRRVHDVSLLPTLATDSQRPGQTRATFQLDILRYISLATCCTSLASL